MAIVPIGLGTVDNDNTGDSLKVAGGKINASVADLKARTDVAVADANYNTAQKQADKIKALEASTGGSTTVVDNLTSTSATNALSANQGTVLNGLITGLQTSLTGLTHTSITNIDLKPTTNANEYVVEIQWTDKDGNAQTTTDSTPITVNGATTVEDVLTSASTSNALSANQGKVLKDLLDLLTTQVGTNTTNITALQTANTGTNTGDQDISGITTNATAITNLQTATGLDATGFDGNLATTDNTIQKVSQKVDDLLIPTTTNGLTNQGADNTSTYVENDEIVALAKAGLKIKDENGIDKGTVNEFLQIDDTLVWDDTNKRLSSSLTIPPNTFFGGMSTVWTTKELMAASFTSVIEETNAGSGGWVAQDIQDNIKNFKIENGIISCHINKPYHFNTSSFGRVGELGETMTFMYDYDGMLRYLSGNQFRDNPNIERIILNGCLEVFGVFCFSGATSLTQAFLPKCKKMEGFTGCTSLQNYDFSKTYTLGRTFLNRNNLTKTTIEQEDFHNVRELSSIAIRGTNFTSITLPNLEETKSNSPFRTNLFLTEFIAPKLKILTSYAFEGCLLLTKLDFPLLESVGTTDGLNGSNAFNCAGLELLNIPNCKVLGSSPSVNDSIFINIKTGCVINIHESMKTNNAGQPDADLVYARDTRNCIINYIADKNQSFEEEVIPIVNTYADDAAASAGGVEVGRQYIRTTGLTAVRLT